MRGRGLVGTALILFGLMLGAPSASLAQIPPPSHPLPPPPADPRNITGVWQVVKPIFIIVHYQPSGAPAPVDLRDRVLWPNEDKDLPPFNAAGKKLFDERYTAKINNNPYADPSTNCVPHGIPRMMIAPYPMQMVQTPGLVTMMFETNHNIRLIHLDQKMPKHVPHTPLGYSVGHWEGDTLVIETQGLMGDSIIDELGTPQSTSMHTTERLRKIDGGILEDMVTLDDPVYYTKPWVARVHLQWRPDLQLQEYVCEENNRNIAVDGKATAIIK